MTCLYIVRCNFLRADREAAWNDWYSGPKTRQLLSKPMFRAGQRFRRAHGSGRSYLALWQIESPAALTTPDYEADWGFADWRDFIADWSRDLFDATGIADGALAVPMSGALRVIAFDGMEKAAADTARAALPETAETLWFPAAGLDRHTPMIGLRPETAGRAAFVTPAGIEAGEYRPISAYCTAGR